MTKAKSVHSKAGAPKKHGKNTAQKAGLPRTKLAKTTGVAKAIKTAIKQPKSNKASVIESKAKPKASKEDLLKLKLYREQEKLWNAKLNDILSNAYVRQLLVDLAGENALELIRNFGTESSDEDLSKKLKLKISDVRATLNKLHNYGLVFYNRQKNSETGWYSYSWMLDKSKISSWASDHLEARENLLKEDNNTYFCPECGIESMLHFEKATEHNFRCPSCDKGLEFLDEERLKTLNKP